MMNYNKILYFFIFIYGLVLVCGCTGSRFRNIDVYVRQQNWLKARTALEESSQNNPRDGEVYLQLAEVYAELGMIPQMSASLARAKSISVRYRDQAEFIRQSQWIKNFKRGNRRFDERLFTEATVYYRRAFQIDSNNIHSLRRYAAALFQTAHYRQAEKIYGIILRSKPDDLNVKNNLAEIYFIQKKYQPCVKLCDAIIAESATDIQAILRRAYANDALDDFERAEKDYLLASAKKPSAQLLMDFGLLYFRYEDYQKAIARFTEALTYSAGNVLLYRQLGEANWRRRNYAEMANWYQKIVQSYPGDLQSWKNLAIAYEAMGQKEPLAQARHYINRGEGWRVKSR